MPRADRIDIPALSVALSGLTLRDFMRLVERFVYFAARRDEAIADGARLWSTSGAVAYRRCCSDLTGEADRLTHQVTLAISRLLHLTPPAARSDARASTRDHFRLLKHCHIELLLGISDEIRTITDLIRTVRRLQSAMEQNAKTLHHTSWMVEMMHERMAHRPTTLLRLPGGGEKGAELNAAMARIKDFEEAQHADVRRDVAANPVTRAAQACIGVLQESYQQIQIRNRRIADARKELIDAHALLRKIGRDGYSLFMKRKINRIRQRHTERRDILSNRIQDARAHHYTEPPA